MHVFLWVFFEINYQIEEVSLVGKALDHRQVKHVCDAGLADDKNLLSYDFSHCRSLFLADRFGRIVRADLDVADGAAGLEGLGLYDEGAAGSQFLAAQLGARRVRRHLGLDQEDDVFLVGIRGRDDAAVGALHLNAVILDPDVFHRTGQEFIARYHALPRQFLPQRFFDQIGLAARHADLRPAVRLRGYGVRYLAAHQLRSHHADDGDRQQQHDEVHDVDEAEEFSFFVDDLHHRSPLCFDERFSLKRIFPAFSINCGSP